MSKLNRWKSATALFLTLSMSGGAIAPIALAPIIAPAPAVAQTTGFPDVPSNYWAAEFIAELVERDIIAGFPDGTFRPNDPVTRAQFAAMLRQAFNQPEERSAVEFEDVPGNYWAYQAIQEAYETGFLAGYPGNVFRPDQNIPREQVLVSLANGLDYQAEGSVNNVLGLYNDAASISNFARAPIAAATEQQLVVNYPNISSLNPTRNATRAEVAAFIYQALVGEGQVQAISSPYIVGQEEPEPTAFTIPAGTAIPVSYEQEKIVLARDETVPVSLAVAANVTTADGTTLIPVDTQVRGELRPVEDGQGVQFVAQELVLPNGETLPINATSQVVTETETVRRGSNFRSLLRNAAVGAGAATVISAVTGDKAIATEEVLAGAGVGAAYTLIRRLIGGGGVELFVVEPNTDLDLTLNEELTLSTEQ